MLEHARRAARWVRRHALPVATASVVVLGAAGGGIGYSLSGQRATAAPVSATTGTSASATAPAKPRRAAGEALIAGALKQLSTLTGVPVAEIRRQLAAGSPIDTIAGDKAETVESAILDRVTKLADRAVKAGKVTKAQEQSFLSAAPAEIEKLMADGGAQRRADLRELVKMLRARATTP